MITYREFGVDCMDEVIKIYEKAGWLAYLGNKEKLIRTFDNSLYILGAFEENNLLGFIRCVGDGEHIVYVQDLIVDVEYKRRGIGRELMERAMNQFMNVRMITLITDSADEVSNSFYKAIGLKKYDDNGLSGYFR